jgi:hypothetical protein
VCRGFKSLLRYHLPHFPTDQFAPVPAAVSGQSPRIPGRWTRSPRWAHPPHWSGAMRSRPTGRLRGRLPSLPDGVQTADEEVVNFGAACRSPSVQAQPSSANHSAATRARTARVRTIATRSRRFIIWSTYTIPTSGCVGNVTVVSAHIRDYSKSAFRAGEFTVETSWSRAEV